MSLWVPFVKLIPESLRNTGNQGCPALWVAQILQIVCPKKGTHSLLDGAERGLELAEESCLHGMGNPPPNRRLRTLAL